MDAFTQWLSQDYHWVFFIVGQLFGSCLALYAEVESGIVVTRRWERNLHFAAILLWEITLVGLVLFTIGFFILMGFQSLRDFFTKVKQTYSLS